jgi:hypothetical protein
MLLHLCYISGPVIVEVMDESMFICIPFNCLMEWKKVTINPPAHLSKEVMQPITILFLSVNVHIMYLGQDTSPIREEFLIREDYLTDQICQPSNGIFISFLHYVS